MTTFLSPLAWIATPKLPPRMTRGLGPDCFAADRRRSRPRFLRFPVVGAISSATRLDPKAVSGFSQHVNPSTLVDLYRAGLVERARTDAFLHKVDGSYRPVSSREVVERITRVCAALLDVGIRPGDRVGILSETRLEWAIADFAVLTAGAATVPIYPTLPAAQIEPLFADSEVTALFCSTTSHFDKVLASW